MAFQLSKKLIGTCWRIKAGMGNEVGKGKYAKMGKVDAANSTNRIDKSDQSSKTTSRYVAPVEESGNSPLSKLASLKQGINSGYHSVVLSPKPDDTGCSEETFSNGNKD